MANGESISRVYQCYTKTRLFNMSYSQWKVLAPLITLTILGILVYYLIMRQSQSGFKFGTYAVGGIYTAQVSGVCREAESDNLYILGRGICNNDTSKAISFIQFTNYSLLDTCGVTTAALRNPNRGICVLQAEGVTLERKYVERWSKLGNVQVMKLEPMKLVEGTEIKPWYLMTCQPQAIKTNVYIMSQVADAFRLLYLYKYGGISLDTDVLSLKPFPDFSNTVCMEDGTRSILNNAVMIFDKGNPFLTEAVKQFPNYAKSNWYASGGPWLLSNVYRQRAKLYGHRDSVKHVINVLPPIIFYPFYFLDPIPKPFLASYYNEMVRMCEYSITLHLYRSIFAKLIMDKGQAEEGSFVGRILSQDCA